ncbi:hypothetical protein [Microbulbifer hydrolyticus]|uniref:Transposase n=1 Tax=Microbulbifer hydrolyticus TaxID=48074 RepID=A0AA89PAK2_9GAMM|nr:hypothetical protein [Microbulbifer hydrolyticus]MBB5210524.1 hypothetical protein [Microbulbifer hydrolyticus]
MDTHENKVHLASSPLKFTHIHPQDWLYIHHQKNSHGTPAEIFGISQVHPSLPLRLSLCAPRVSARAGRAYGQCFEHFRQRIEDKVLALTQVFALDVGTYAVMSNHYHVVLHIDQARAAGWEMREVVERWHQLCKGSALSQRFARNEPLDTAELARLTEVAEVCPSACRTILSW